MRPLSFSRPTLVLIYGVYFHVFLEWLFFLTRPANSSGFSAGEALRQLAFGPVIPLAFAGALQLTVSRLTRKLDSKNNAVTWIPAFVWALSAWLLFDNFTFTLFKTGIGTTDSFWRWSYVALLGAFTWLARSWWFEPAAVRPLPLRWSRIALTLFALSLAGSVIGWWSSEPPLISSTTGDRRAPDIFLVSGDALEADLLTPYGAADKQTPFLRDFAKQDAVVFQNAFANLNRTSGSLASVLTGRYGTTTHKLHSGHVLKGRASYEHLPAVLKSLGYRSIQLGWRHHADAIEWNMRNAFDRVNRRRDITNVRWLRGRLSLETLFVHTMWMRLNDRFRHIFGVEPMDDVPGRKRKIQSYSDARRLKTLEQFLSNSPGPVFAQLHFNWVMTPGSARRFDRHVQRLVSHLRSVGRYDNALIVIYSDHGRRYRIDRRLPLIVKWPKGTNLDKLDLASNAQLIDIAPTVLDVVGARVPAWAEGQSLLRPRDPSRPVLGTWSVWNSRGIPLRGRPSTKRGGPTHVQMIIGNTVYRMDKSGHVNVANVPAHTAPARRDPAPDAETARNFLIRHLAERGYDVDQMDDEERS